MAPLLKEVEERHCSGFALELLKESNLLQDNSWMNSRMECLLGSVPVPAMENTDKQTGKEKPNLNLMFLYLSQSPMEITLKHKMLCTCSF